MSDRSTLATADSGRQAMVVAGLFAAVVALAIVVVVAPDLVPIPTASSDEFVPPDRPEPVLTPEEAARAKAIAEAAETPPADLLAGPVSGMLGRQLVDAPPLPASMRSHEVDAAASSYDDLMGYDGKVFAAPAGKPLLVEGRKTPRSLPKPRSRKAPAAKTPKKARKVNQADKVPAAAAVAEVAPAAPEVAAAPAERAAPPVPADQVPQTLTRAKRSLNQGDPRGAVQAYRQALASQPGNLRARYGLAKARYAMNDVSKAREELRRVLKASPQHSGALLMMASVLRETGDKGGAKTQYQRYLSAHPEGRHASEVKRMLAKL